MQTAKHNIHYKNGCFIPIISKQFDVDFILESPRLVPLTRPHKRGYGG